MQTAPDPRAPGRGTGTGRGGPQCARPTPAQKQRHKHGLARHARTSMAFGGSTATFAAVLGLNADHVSFFKLGGSSLTVSCSFLEVYNERIYDLLAGEHGLGIGSRRRRRGKSLIPARELAIKQDSAGRVVSAWAHKALAALPMSMPCPTGSRGSVS